MAVDIPFRHEIAFEYGRLEPVAPGVRRIVAKNPGPFTFKGTGTYVVGEGEVAVIDPGPELEEHVAALLASLAEEQVTHILVTHTHRDHSPAAKALKAATGAPGRGLLADSRAGDHRAPAACPGLYRASPRARGRHHRLPKSGSGDDGQNCRTSLCRPQPSIARGGGPFGAGASDRLDRPRHRHRRWSGHSRGAFQAASQAAEPLGFGQAGAP